MTISKLQRSYYGAIGALAPDIVIFYSKRWTMPSLSFDVWQYVAVTALYVALAALVAAIYPYGKHPTHWKAFSVGAGLPLVIAGLTSFQHGQVISPRGGSIPGTVLDLMSLF